MSMAKRSATRFFFSLARRERFRIPQLGGADLLTDGDEFPHQIAETAVFSDLRLGAFHRWARRNHLGDRFPTDAMSQRIGGTVSWGILLGAVAVRLATFTETRGQKTGTQIVDVGHASGELVAFIPQCFQGSGHGCASCLTDIIACQIQKENPTTPYQTSTSTLASC